MKKKVPLIVVVFALTFQLAVAEDQYRYEPGKMIEDRAELNCQTLASMSLGTQAMESISLHIKPDIIGTEHNGNKVIVVSFPYRADGVSFACMFYDYTNGQLQLFEFGHVGNNTDDVTSVKLLY